ncbi:NAD(P)-dependent oxidoreductase [Aureimonas altamirensis]|uniref:NAD(P)-dependent oxidoreductase n=1 Tax=Aureimonas altamirensis TaxID=370622 RepID=UPI002036CD38|nr:NAD(P)-dependent oxidoreductase [Aureimonas altamirensis]MCM2505989.1 NAD(P)-dependent oxidoreductase [Aureimonas altamirensis]
MPSKRALIGHTGFVGSQLKRDGAFTHLFNSSNFQDMAGEEFDEVVCAGVSAIKWLANKEPEKDWRDIAVLLDTLTTVTSKRFTLVSTIDVYPDPCLAVCESHVPASEDGQPYGRHRLEVEQFVRMHFNDVLVVRLPALFGKGLKKNVIYDLLTNNQTDRIVPNAVFQWYPLARLTADLEVAREAGLTLVNLFPEPISNERIVGELFPGAVIGPAAYPAPRYDLTTQHSALFGATAPYRLSANEVMAELYEFVTMARRDPETMLA